MAKNRNLEYGRQISVPVASGTLSGDPVVVGQLPGVAVIDRDAAGNATVQFDGVYNLSVKGIDQSGNSAVAVGDILYHTQADTPKVSKKNTGVRFGYALDAVVSAATTTIRVKVGY